VRTMNPVHHCRIHRGSQSPECQLHWELKARSEEAYGLFAE
jgi:hypothetical protein